MQYYCQVEQEFQKKKYPFCKIIHIAPHRIIKDYHYLICEVLFQSEIFVVDIDNNLNQHKHKHREQITKANNLGFG